MIDFPITNLLDDEACLAALGDFQTPFQCRVVCRILAHNGVLSPMFTSGESAKVGKLRKEQSHG
jgi:hypothetical protein